MMSDDQLIIVILDQEREPLLPGLELLGGVTADLRTVIAVPVLLTSRAEIEAISEKLNGSERPSALSGRLCTSWTFIGALL